MPVSDSLTFASFIEKTASTSYKIELLDNSKYIMKHSIGKSCDIGLDLGLKPRPECKCASEINDYCDVQIQLGQIDFLADSAVERD